MLPKTNIERQLEKSRRRRIGSESILNEVNSIFAENEFQRKKIHENLWNAGAEVANDFQIEKLDLDRIYHIEDIKKLCINYRLRFVDAHYFKKEFPEEAITKIRILEKEHGVELNNFKLVAPAKLLKLENADDPLLFAPMGNDFFYLVHKWGNDLHPLRKWAMWPFRDLENLVFAVFVFSLILTFLTPLHFIVDDPGVREKIILFMFVFNWTGGMVLLIGIGKGKNVNSEIWNSKYYNA
ncbi:MAG TPA: hypothetical protein VFM82_00280 [Flavobacteriaceae bacterium]|nr:hypothetical protein [Flavobacteriaceae bacterium]